LWQRNRAMLQWKMSCNRKLTIPTTATEQPPVLPIILSSEKPANKMKEITDRLEQGILGIYESDRYADYLRTMSKFHDYSLNNTILIAMQGGNLVKGYKQWEKEFDRHVKPGEKAIKIIAPAPFTVKKRSFFHMVKIHSLLLQ
jgi:hypothetical protein